jgi:hypothetical protein
MNLYIVMNEEPRLEKSVPEWGVEGLIIDADAGDDDGVIEEPSYWVETEDLPAHQDTLDLHVLEGGVNAGTEEYVFHFTNMLRTALSDTIEGVELLFTVDQMLQATEHEDLQVLANDLTPTETRILSPLIECLHKEIDSKKAYKVLLNYYADMIHQAETIEAANKAYDDAIALLTPPKPDAQWLAGICLNTKEWIKAQEQADEYDFLVDRAAGAIETADTIEEANAAYQQHCYAGCKLLPNIQQWLGKLCYDRKDELRGRKAIDVEREWQRIVRAEIHAREEQLRQAEPVTIVAVVRPREHVNVPMIIGTGNRKRLQVAFDEESYQRMTKAGWTEYR